MSADKKKPLRTIIGDDGDYEWLCPHGVGHGSNIHTCDGCCGTDPDYQRWLARRAK